MDTLTYIQENKDLIDKLKQIPTLSAFEEHELKEWVRFSEVRYYKPNDMIIEEGTSDGWVYYLISGKVRIVKAGKEILILQCSGDVFGEMGIINSATRSASVFAIDEVSCIALDISNVDKLSINNKFAFRYLMFKEFSEVLANRLRITTQELIETKKELEKFNIINRLVQTTEELCNAKNEISRLQSLLDKRKK
ncbi:MAG: cyclic nucleotide-binding domain-containing protein [Desulfobacterales bacterium]|nr:cyclic nucleotide-binding domain-containing protein [Desulfobacterales bacterium]